MKTKLKGTNTKTEPQGANMKFIQPCLIAAGLLLLAGVSGSYAAAEEIPEVKNPSFEIGSDSSVQGWAVHPGIEEGEGRSVVIVKNKPVDGEQAVELKAGAGNVDNQWLLQDIPVTEGTKKQLVVRVHAKGIGRGQVHMIFYNAEGTGAGPVAEQPFSPIEDYLPYELSLEIPPGAVRMRLHIGALGPGGAITFDKVEIIDAAKTPKTGTQKEEPSKTK
ncbi:MAG: hypothetical protein Q8O19_01870 [Rectinemataceae bacterium]|nr:hypothetical protein [Rectinemataceae bacterium]